MKDAQKPDHVGLNTLINRLREGQFVIPDFQREFEWKPWDIRELMRSIFLDYYIGSLLLWRGSKENFSALSCEPVYGHTGEQRPEYIVLDGQQRLTAIYYAFFAPDAKLPNRTSPAFYYVRIDNFINEEYDQAFHYDWRTHRWNNVLKNPQLQFKDHIFPLSIIGAGGWALPNWIQGYGKFWQDKADEANTAGDAPALQIANQCVQNARIFGEHLKGITEQYQISYIELDKDLAVDKVCDIFTQINSRGIRLDAFDLINALLKPKGLQLKHMWRTAAPRLDFVDTPKMNVYILQVMSILRQAYCSPKYLYFLLPGQKKSVRDSDGTRRQEILIADEKEFNTHWHVAVDALEEAINLLKHPQEFGAISSKYLPYVSILPVFAAIHASLKALPPQQRFDARRKIHHWYWASVFTNRYSGSVESTSARDFLDMQTWFKDDTAEPALLLEFKNRFRNLDFRKETKRSTSVYNGVFNLLILQGAQDWMTGNVPQHDDLDDHHIIPASWGKQHLEGSLIHTILNRAPLTSDTNRNIINDQLPNAYLPDLIAHNGEDRVRMMLESHFISAAAQKILMRTPFTPDDFEAFITERQRTLQDGIENLLIKARIDLSPHLRELDRKIEEVELSFRHIIHTICIKDSLSIPTHIEEKIRDRINRALKKNAALDIDNYQSLAGKLEYADLRELENIMTNKQLWPSFEPVFKNKVTLQMKFDQLAELRNGIRHSRNIDQIIRKEGEAALLWFEKVLPNA